MNNWKTGTRIAAGFAATILLTLVLGIFAYAELGRVKLAATRITEGAMPGIEIMGRLQSSATTRFQLLEEYVNSNVINGMLGTAGSAEAKAEASRQEKGLQAADGEEGALLKSYEGTITTDQDRALYEAIRKAEEPYARCFAEVINLSLAGKHKDALDLISGKLKPLRAQLGDAITAQVNFNKSSGDEASLNIMRAVTGTSTGILITLVLSVCVGVAISLVVTRSIAKPLGAAVEHLNNIAEGNLTLDAKAEFQTRGDEIGTLSRAMQTMIVSLRAMMKEITGGVQVLSSSSSHLLASSGQMTTGAQQASGRVHSVSTAAEEMSSNITSLARGMEATTDNLASVASATEQMTATIDEIAGNSEKARQITNEATKQAARITYQINELGTAAREIGRVTEAITEISSQTNLLALNATIEAARAGAAGKGFAVVANEIKALAQQTANATEDIKARIEGVQSATASGIAEISLISNIIEQVSAIVESIAAAIEEQSMATKGIARSITEASSGVTEANSRVSETSQASRVIAHEIVEVDHVAGEMATGSNNVRSSATELASVAENLKMTVARFRV
jgi:methyl-accepting chemotaxis protein